MKYLQTAENRTIAITNFKFDVSRYTRRQNFYFEVYSEEPREGDESDPPPP